MSDAKIDHIHGTGTTTGTTVKNEAISGPAPYRPNWTKGTAKSMSDRRPSVVVPAVPLGHPLTGLKTLNDTNAVPLVPAVQLLPRPHGKRIDLVRAFEALFNARANRARISLGDGACRRLSSETAHRSMVMPHDAGRKLGPPSADLVTISERAALMERDGGISRMEADEAAAREAGFACTTNAHAAVVDQWRNGLQVLARADALCRPGQAGGVT